ncbi:MAG TPA: RidA family protein [Tepidisphaeraceae bacterium]|jgi:enamine deaminase RidA (YjgF/YER057c/UK114 family)|nr:RidA family protein [Tepidisphaeraceae bacterium]
MTKSLSQRLAELGLELPKVMPTNGAYTPARRVGNLVFVAGQLPRKAGVLLVEGNVPSKCSLEKARESTKQCVINGLAAAASVVGSPDDIVGAVRVGVFVLSDGGFNEQSKVADGASELLMEIFGEAGRHARTSVGVNALPVNASVEVDFVFEVR